MTWKMLKKQMMDRKIIMNIIETESPLIVIARTCNYKEKNNMRSKVTYRLIDSYHSLCLDKKDIIRSELEACDRLLKHTSNKTDQKTVETEIAELKTALDLFS
jgi:hypothetical protein